MTALASTAAVRVPTCAVGFGGGALADFVVALRLSAGLAPAVDAVEVVLGPGASAPAVGDAGTVELGYDDAGTTLVFTGVVDGVRRALDGTVRVVATGAAAPLARLRVNNAYDGRTAGDVVSDLVSTAGATAGTVQPGISFAYLVVDDRRSGWEHVAALARSCGFLACCTPAGEVAFGPPVPGAPAASFAYAVDVLALEIADAAPNVGAVTAVGEGAAGAQGSDAWSWVLEDASAVTGSSGSGDPTLLVEDGGLRSASAAQAAADGIAATAALLDRTGRLVVPGAPAVAVGSTVAVSGAPDGALDGSYLVRSVRHRLSRAEGFVSTFDLSAP